MDVVRRAVEVAWAFRFGFFAAVFFEALRAATKSFQVFGQYFNFEGHIEFIAPRENEFGDEVAWHIFGQPQFRWDVGYALFGRKNHLFVGTEYQIWIHKLGEKQTSESAFQALGVWRF